MSKLNYEAYIELKTQKILEFNIWLTYEKSLNYSIISID